MISCAWVTKRAMEMVETRNSSGLWKASAAAIACVLVSSCVSDTLSTQDTAPQPLAQTETVNYDPAQRELAVQEIRAKVDAPGSGQLTSAYVTNDGPTTPLTAQEQADKIAELEQSANQNSGSVSDAELAAKQQSIRDLRNQAKTHYNSAVNTIKN